MPAHFKISKCFSFSFLLINKKKKQQCRFKKGEAPSRLKWELYNNIMSMLLPKRGENDDGISLLPPSFQGGWTWPAKPAVIIHSSSTNICLLRFRSYRKKGERWLFPVAIVRRKWTLQVIPASICKAVSGITTNIQKRLSGCSWKDERSYFPLPSFLREPTKNPSLLM